MVHIEIRGALVVTPVQRHDERSDSGKTHEHREYVETILNHSLLTRATELSCVGHSLLQADLISQQAASFESVHTTLAQIAYPTAKWSFVESYEVDGLHGQQRGQVSSQLKYEPFQLLGWLSVHALDVPKLYKN